jgi:hypothetical protein
MLLWPVLAAVALHFLVGARHVARERGDLSGLVCVGESRAAFPAFKAISRTVGRDGYDGQFYYALALAPWRRCDWPQDCAPARQLRILYPALCWLLSGGDGVLLLWVMPAVNLAAIAGLAGLGAWLAGRHGLSPWWGFHLPLALNTGLPTLRNLTDPLSTLALFGLLAAWLVRAPAWVMAVAAAAAVFSREQNVAIVGLLLAAALWERHGWVAAVLGVVVACWCAWAGVLRLVYGEWPFLPGEGNFGAPLQGYLFRWTHLGYPSGTRRETLLHLTAMLCLTLQAVVAGYLWLRAPAGQRVMPLVAIAGAVLAVQGGYLIYQDIWGYARVLVWLPLGVWLAALQARQRWILLLLTPAVVPTLMLARLF